MAELIRDPFTGQYSFANPNQVINNVTGQTAASLATPAPTAQAAPAITPQDLSGTENAMSAPQAPPVPPPDTSQMGDYYMEELKKELENTKKQTSVAEAEGGSIYENIKNLILKQGTAPQRKAELENQAGVPTLNLRLNEVVEQIRQNNLGAFSATQNEENRLAPMFAITGAQAQIERMRAVKNYGLAAAAESIRGNIALAQDNIQRALDAEFKPLEAQLELQKLALEQNRDTINRLDKKAGERLQMLLSERERVLGEEKLEKQSIYSVLSAAAQYGAPKSVLSAIQKSSSYADALQAAGAYTQDPRAKFELEKARTDAQLSALELARTKAGVASKAPEVKTINGVDMQWNPEKNKWESIGGAEEQSDKAKAQLRFLRNTIRDANELTKFAGQGSIGVLAGDILGQSQYRKLEQAVDTLRVNVLALMTDPTIKKFFGPQMSNADVLLMTSSGTTLNAQRSDPESLNAELERLDELFKRMQTAVVEGAEDSSGERTIAPNGDEVIIID